jgi:hypothetical protein
LWRSCWRPTTSATSCARSERERPFGAPLRRRAVPEPADGEHDAAKKRLTEAEKRLKRFQDAVAAEIEPSGLVDAINEAQAQWTAAQAELEGAPAPTVVADAEGYALIDSLGNVGAVLRDANTERLEQLYQALRLERSPEISLRQWPLSQRPHRLVSTPDESTARTTRASVRAGPAGTTAASSNPGFRLFGDDERQEH